MARGPFVPFLRTLDAVRRSADTDAQLLSRFAADVIRPHGQFTAVVEIKPVELPAGETVKLQFKVREKQ